MAKPLWRPPILETPRLILRPMELTDLPAVFLYASNPRITAHTLFATHETLEDSYSFVSDYVMARSIERVFDPYGIVMKDDPTKTLIGAIGCQWSSKTDFVQEIGYTIAEPYWGRGIATEAGRVLVDAVFENQPAERIQCRVFDGNEASLRVAEKIGFIEEGVLRRAAFSKGRFRDVHIFAMLRDEWEERPRLKSSCSQSSEV